MKRFGLLALVLPFHSQALSSATAATATKTQSETKADFSQEPAVFEYVHESMRYENDGSGTRELRSRIRVQTQAGLSVAGQLVFEYNAFDEQMDVRSVRVFKVDGSIVTAGPEAVQDLSAPVTQEAPMYTDARQKHVTVPGLSVGDAVEYDVVINAKPLLPGQFWRIWTLTDRVIVLDQQVDLNVPSSRKLKLASSAGLEPSVSVQGERRLYHWATSNLKTPPAVDFFKDFKFDVVKLLGGYRSPPASRIMFSTFQSWSEVADWYAQLERQRRVATPEVRKKADEITHGQQTDEAKAQALYYWVSQNIRYVSLSFGVGRYQPHAAAEVLANRYGDCKDKTTLLEAMLEAEGLHANPVLVNLKEDVDPEMPNPMQFDHAIALLRIGNKDAWLDSTLGVAPFGYLAPQLRNTEALVVSDTSPTGLRKMPQELPFNPEYRVGIEGTIDKQGILDASVELKTRGDLEVLIRLLNAHLAMDQLAKTADSVLARTNSVLYGSPQYSDFHVANPTEISLPVRAQFRVRGKLMFVDPNATPANITSAVSSLAIGQLRSLSLLPGLAAKSDSNGKPQQMPIHLKGPASYSLTLKLTFPDLPKSDVPPTKEVHFSRGFAEFQSRDSWEGTTLTGSKSLDVQVPEISAGDSIEYAAFVKSIADAFLPPIEPKVEPKLESKATPAPTHSRPAADKYVPSDDVQGMYKRGEDESKRKNWANAIEAFGSATRADPKYPDAWRELGRARMFARQFPDAEIAFRKYLELAPNDHLAYSNMGWVLSNERKFEEERDLMLKRIAVAPNDGDALFRLGSAYLALKQSALAVPVLEQSIVQYPQYIAAHLSLGHAYLENHQDLLARVILRKAVTLDDSESTLNNAAYLLGEHGAFLDLAEDWSKRSVDIVERELNNSTISNVQSSTWTLVGTLSHYWDTLGWIKFHQDKTDEAQKYLLAAWQLTDDAVIGYHLGRAYEIQGRKDEAVEMYVFALNSVPPNRTTSDEATEIRKRLAGVLGADSLIDERLQQSRKRKSPLHAVNIANPDGAQGMVQYTIIIDADSKVVELSATGADDPLAGLNDAVRAATVPQSFPDTTLKKLPRLSSFVCTAPTQPCVLTLLSAYAARRLAPLD